jgi:hypothetical protein
MQAQQLEQEGSLTLPEGSDPLRGPTHDEAVLRRLNLPRILPLTAPGSGEETTDKGKRSREQEEEEEAEAREIEEEFAEMLNEEGMSLLV